MIIGSGNRDLTETFSDIFVRALDSLASNPEASQFGGFMPVVKDLASLTTGPGGYGAAEIVEGEGQVRIFFDVPGTNKSDIKLELVKGQKEYILKMVSTRKPVFDSILSRGSKNERFYGTKTREVALPIDVDPLSMVARHSDGVLAVTVKTVKNESSSRAIPII